MFRENFVKDIKTGCLGFYQGNEQNVIFFMLLQ